MRALQPTGPETLEPREVPVPEIGPTDLLLKVAAAGICHSDLHVLHIPFKMRDDPLTIGHEISGTIEARRGRRLRFRRHRQHGPPRGRIGGSQRGLPDDRTRRRRTGDHGGALGRPGLAVGRLGAKVVRRGTRSDLINSVKLAKSGKLRVEVERFDLADGREALIASTAV